MNFNNIKIKTKLFISFACIILMCFFIGNYGLKNIYTLNKGYNTLINYPIERSNISKELQSIVLEIRILEYKIISNLGSGSIEELDKLIEKIQTLEQKYEKSLSNDNDINILDENAKSNYTKIFDKIKLKTDEFLKKYNNLKNIKLDEDNMIFYKENIDSLKEISSMLDQLNKIDNIVIEDRLQNANDYMKNTFIVTLILTILVIIISIIFATLSITRISKSINFIIDAAYKISKGDLKVNLKTNSKDEFGLLSNSIYNMVNIFHNLTNEIEILSKELEEHGDIDYRINEEIFEGDYKNVVNGINNAIAGLVGDINTTLDVILDYGNGNFDVKVKQFPGKKVILNNAINQLQNNLKEISEDINTLAISAYNGNLSNSINTKKYNAMWKEIAKNLNNLLVACENPIKEISLAFDNISKGKFDTLIEGDYSGDFAKIKETANLSILTIREYIVEISTVLQEIAVENLSVSIDREYLGEFTNIKDSINRITSNLGVLIKNINESIFKVYSNAEQISKASIKMAQGATEQNIAGDRLALTIDTIFNQIKDNTKNANETSNITIDTKENTAIGNDYMKRMLISMKEINDSSENISKIIKVINDIAFQTNLLALNAAVEAARAGEHGKGFAVVAEEVRELAQRSKNAAQETSELIENSILKADIGSKTANQTAEVLKTIVDEINNISDLILEVAKASNEQTKSLEEIVSNTNQISSVVQVNVTISEDIASVAQELFSQTELLKSLFSTFKL